VSERNPTNHVVWVFVQTLLKEGREMIKVTCLDDSKLLVNVEKIQSLKEAPDTVITFTNKASMMVKESVEELSRKIIEYRRSVRIKPLINPKISYGFSIPIN
jgi:flagellar protein FlbD